MRKCRLYVFNCWLKIDGKAGSISVVAILITRFAFFFFSLFLLCKGCFSVTDVIKMRPPNVTKLRFDMLPGGLPNFRFQFFHFLFRHFRLPFSIIIFHFFRRPTTKCYALRCYVILAFYDALLNGKILFSLTLEAK